MTKCTPAHARRRGCCHEWLRMAAGAPGRASDGTFVPALQFEGLHGRCNSGSATERPSSFVWARGRVNEFVLRRRHHARRIIGSAGRREELDQAEGCSALLVRSRGVRGGESPAAWPAPAAIRTAAYQFRYRPRKGLTFIRRVRSICPQFSSALCL